MRIVSFDPAEPGLFAFGQEAVGVFAFGQMALGVVAVGQLARGVFALGQLAVGFFAVGQLAIGVRHATGMIGFGGDGHGLVLRWLPRPDPEPKDARPEATPVEHLRTGQVEEGWLRARIQGNGDAVALYSEEGELLGDVTLENPGMRASLEMAASVGRREALVRVRVGRKLADPGSGYRTGARDEGVELEALEAQTWEAWAPGRLGAMRREMRAHPWRMPARFALLMFCVLVFSFVTLVPLLASVFEVDALRPVLTFMMQGHT